MGNPDAAIAAIFGKHRKPNHPVRNQSNPVVLGGGFRTNQRPTNPNSSGQWTHDQFNQSDNAPPSASNSLLTRLQPSGGKSHHGRATELLSSSTPSASNGTGNGLRSNKPVNNGTIQARPIELLPNPTSTPVGANGKSNNLGPMRNARGIQAHNGLVARAFSSSSPSGSHSGGISRNQRPTEALIRKSTAPRELLSSTPTPSTPASLHYNATSVLPQNSSSSMDIDSNADYVSVAPPTRPRSQYATQTQNQRTFGVLGSASAPIEKEPEKEKSVQVVVEGLIVGTTDNDVFSAFSPHFPSLQSSSILPSSPTFSPSSQLPANRTSALLLLPSQTDAKALVQMFNGIIADEFELRVYILKPKEVVQQRKSVATEPRKERGSVGMVRDALRGVQNASVLPITPAVELMPLGIGRMYSDEILATNPRAKVTTIESLIEQDQKRAQRQRPQQQHQSHRSQSQPQPQPRRSHPYAPSSNPKPLASKGPASNIRLGRAEPNLGAYNHPGQAKRSLASRLGA